jgi:intracellular septation protein
MSDRPTADPTPTDHDKPAAGGAKMLIELAPLALFIGAWALYGMKTAAGVLAVSTVAALIVAWFALGHVTKMMVFTAAIAVVTATLTYVLDDPKYVKMKPTVVNALFAAVLGAGLLSGKTYLKLMLGEALQLDETGWRKLTVRWIGFFAAVAVLNEIVWRTSSDGTWISFKALLIPASIAFMLAQMPLINRYGPGEKKGP